MGGNWGWEMAAVLLSCCSLAATITVLKLYDGINVDSWKFYFSLSTTLSILSQVSRTSMAFALTSCIGQAKWNWFSRREDRLATFSQFDAASRGPLGMSADFGTLSQVGSVFLTSANGSRGNNIWVYEYQIEVEEGWSLAVFEGFAHKYDGNQKIYAPTSFTCASANCTYEIFDSLAVCSECLDVSEHITSEPYSDSTSGEQIKYVLGRQTQGDSAVTLMNSKGKLVQGSHSSLEKAFTHTGGKVIADRRETFHFRDAFTTFIVFQILKAPRNYTSQISAWEDEPPEAWECGFSFCLNRYNSTVQDGILYETILSSAKQASPQSMRFDPNLPGSDMKNITNGTEQWHFWSYPSNYTLYSPLGAEVANLSKGDTSKLLWDFYRNSLDLQIPDSWGKLINLRTFPITAQTVRSTIYWFLQQYPMFNGMIPPRLSYNGMIPPRLSYNGVMITDDNDIVGKSIARSANVTETFENAAKRMTAFMRERPKAVFNYEQDYVHGQAFVWVQHIRIRWPFITFPVAVAVTGLAFVLLTTWETKRLGLRAWKEGSLPVLIHGLDRSTRAKLRNADSGGVADKVSKQTVVTLSRDSADGSFELKESKESASSTGALLDSDVSSVWSASLTNRSRDGLEGI
ncbi:hypothetical protein N0V85_008773 [Neurospora sp. IMI 360204]|nr:hypothetical protein N0V85_008773 [Neurospora sp. IMI 360204]